MSFEKSTHGGGRALKFYAHLQLWATTIKKLKKTVKEKERQVGIITRVKVKKNRITGKERSADVTIYHSHGIDDIGSCVDYLLAEGHWKQAKGGINATEFEFKGSKEAIIRKIEAEGLEKDLRVIVGEVWAEIEEACAVTRKSRYE